MSDPAIPPILPDDIDQPTCEPSAADACGFGDGLRRLPALDLLYNPLSTARRQPGILMHVHLVLPLESEASATQLPRSEPDEQPNESSQLAHYGHGRAAGASL